MNRVIPVLMTSNSSSIQPMEEPHGQNFLPFFSPHCIITVLPHGPTWFIMRLVQPLRMASFVFAMTLATVAADHLARLDGFSITSQ
jgi:hypothetical protein